MIHIRNLRDLDKYGITALTGEADALSLRILCDLTHEGARIFREAMGLPYDCVLAENWNSRGVASAMIPHELAPLLGVVALYKDDRVHKIIISDNGVVYGLEEGDDFKHGHWGYANKDGEPYPLCQELTAEEFCNSQAVRLSPDQLMYQGEWHVWWEPSYGKVQRVIPKKHSHPHVGTRNVHAMSGRVA